MNTIKKRYNLFLRLTEHRSLMITTLLLLLAGAAAFATPGPNASKDIIKEDSSALAVMMDNNRVAAFAAIFLVGLALNLTPCVYPMIAVTVSIFGGQTEKNPARVLGKALLYVLGIASMYSALGVTAGMTGGLFGAVLQSRAALTVIAILFFLLAAGMFGAYEFRMPSGLVNKLGSQQTPGLFGIYLSGLFVGIFAAPCIGPPVIALLTLVGQRGEPVFGFAVFFTMSLGLGFPYILLGTFSGLLNKLPKSGSWMVWVKKVMGIALICVGFFYISIAFNPDLIYILIPFAIAVGGIYLGFMEKSQPLSRPFFWFKKVFALTALAGAALFYQSGQTASLEWQPYSTEQFNVARESGKQTILYFSANWCLPCLELNRTTFTDPEVMREMENFQRFKVDLSHADSPQAIETTSRFEVSGVPTIIFFDKTGEETRNKRITGYLSAPVLLEHIGNLKTGIEPEQGNNLVSSSTLPTFPGLADNPSEAFLVSDVAWIQPGQPFSASVLITMRDGWHAYWINPGDSGSPPTMEWHLPPDFTAGPIQWPAPQKFDTPPFTTFGHAKELLLTRAITPPENLPEGETVNITVDLTWLMCKEICVGQEAKITLSLPVHNKPPEPAANFENVFKKHKQALPMLDPNWKFNARMDKEFIYLHVTPPGNIQAETVAQSLFFITQPGIVRYDSFKWQQDEQGMTLQMRRDTLPPGPEISGVLVLPENIATPRAIKVKADMTQ